MTRLWAAETITGMHIPAINKIKLFSPDDWEVFVEEWLTTKNEVYSSIERLGGAGDQGLDVIGFIGDNGLWDNYQCKHYDAPLMPSNVWSEFGKLCYFTYINEFSVPNRYYFVAPQSIGTSLSNLLRSPALLKAELIKNWNKYCSTKITKIKSIKLEGEFLDYVNNFDFGIFDKITPLTLIQEHQKTRFHIQRFGGGIPTRPAVKPAPSGIKKNELPYINKLLKAYTSDFGSIFIGVKDLPPNTKYHNHFSRSREHFHQAEQLKNFSRDQLPPETFDRLKDEMFSGTIDTAEDDHDSGFICVKKVEKEARNLNVASNPLSQCSDGNDRVGICHHLANEGKLNWQVDEDE